jgi:chemotaxis protein CheD
MSTVITDLSRHFLYAGTLYCDAQATDIQTVLGSCVSVCLYDMHLAMGGINHYQLPAWNGEGQASPKFGDVAIEMLVNKMKAMGARKGTLVAKVFGGAAQMEEMTLFNIGKKNIDVAMQMLADFRIPVVTMHVGGMLGRKILFKLHTGQVALKLIEPGIFNSPIQYH